jgi:sphingomyelin phosphodiesterase 2
MESSQSPQEMHILTLNCWGLKYVSSLRRERLTQIGYELARASPRHDIVGLQELWTQEDYASIRDSTRSFLPYGKFYHSGVLGGGLAILSRWPIEESSMLRYPLNGRPTAFWRGDWYVGKGIAGARIRYGQGRKEVVEIFNTHTHAPYESGPKDSYLCHRFAQAWEMGKLLRGACERGHLVLALGDFNMKPGSIPHKIMTGLAADMRDSWRVLHPDSSLGASYDVEEQARHRPIPTADFNIRENGVSSDSVYCTWRWTKADRKRLLGPGKPDSTVPPDSIDARGHRLDYVFASEGDETALGGRWEVADSKVGMMMRHPELGCSLSDHFSVETTLAFRPTASPTTVAEKEQLPEHQLQTTRTVSRNGVIEVLPPNSAADADARNGANKIIATDRDKRAVSIANGSFLQSPTESDFRMSQTSSFPSPADPAAVDPISPFTAAHGRQKVDDSQRLTADVYTTTVSTIDAYMQRERSQRRWRGYHFFVGLSISIGCLVAVWFVDGFPYAAFLLCLASSLSIATGVVDGLIALLFMSWEIKALKEFRWEVVNAEKMAELKETASKSLTPDNGPDRTNGRTGWS